MQAEGLGDGNSIIAGVHETTSSLTSLVSENGQAGTAALTCALLNSLTQLATSR